MPIHISHSPFVPPSFRCFPVTERSIDLTRPVEPGRPFAVHTLGMKLARRRYDRSPRTCLLTSFRDDRRNAHHHQSRASDSDQSSVGLGPRQLHILRQLIIPSGFNLGLISSVTSYVNAFMGAIYTIFIPVLTGPLVVNGEDWLAGWR